MAIYEDIHLAKKPKTNKATEEMLAKLHSAVANELIRKVETQEATAAELSAAIKFLKDNNIEADLSDVEDAVKKMAHTLPSFSDEEDSTVGQFN